MKFRKDIEFPGTSEQVRALMTDPEFRRKVADEAGGRAGDPTSQETAEGLLFVTETRASSDEFPAAVRPFLGTELVIHQEELWTSADHARLSVTVPGLPFSMKGDITLAPGGAGTVQTTDAEIKVNVPLLGGKVEVLLGRVLGSLLKTQGRVGAEWLSNEPEE